jgi:hypothetical protein
MMMTTTTITKICTRVGDKTLCEFEMSRRPHAVRTIELKYYKKETDTVKFVPADMKYEDTAYAKMEAERRPRAAARMKKLKK